MTRPGGAPRRVYTAPVCRGLLLILAASPLLVPLTAAQPGNPPSAAPAGRPRDVQMTCPAQLGVGARTKRVFCDVLIASHADGGVMLQLPRRTGRARLVFDLHTRHTYSAEQERSPLGFLRQTATVAALTPGGDVLARAIVRAEVRREADLFDRITGGAGPSGLKAVAPAGLETVTLDVAPSVNTVSLVGEQLIVLTVRGEDVYTTPGRPVAVVSHPVLEAAGIQSRPPPGSRRR